MDTVYFAKNWKHCSKIIFKCVNSAVRPIFNKKVTEKEVCGSREQCTGPTGVTHSCEIFAGQIGSGSCAQCTGPTDSTVSHVKWGSQ